jgi:hypothetical protein
MSSTKSIRQIIRQGLLGGMTTTQIAAELKLHHPHSAAAAKASKHIAFYRCQMVKDGEIAKGAGVEPQHQGTAKVSKVDSLQAELAELKAMMAQLIKSNQLQ